MVQQFLHILQQMKTDVSVQTASTTTVTSEGRENQLPSVSNPAGQVGNVSQFHRIEQYGNASSYASQNPFF